MYAQFKFQKYKKELDINNEKVQNLIPNLYITEKTSKCFTEGT